MDIKEVQDIHISDAILKNNYSNKYNNKEYEEAYEILDNNAQLNSKKFISEIMNFISNNLLSIQNNYYNNTEDYLNDLNEQYQLIINNYKYLGNWSSVTEYRIYNMVFYNNKYYIYINNTPSVGTVVTNNLYWVELNLKGEKGADGIGINFRNNWDSAVSYSSLDGVYYNGAIWCAKINNINQAPQENSQYWEAVVTFLKAKIISSNIEPIQKYDGLIWIEILS